MSQSSQPTAGARVFISELRKKALIRVALLPAILGLMFFLPAGTLRYWQGWAYMAIFFFPMVFVLAYLLKHNPELLARRMKLREKEREQKVITILSSLLFLVTFLVPGFDRRFGWSSVPAGIVVAADILMLAGYSLFILVLRENPYASRIIEVDRNQKVISTGPYALVRHPMYFAAAVIYIFSPVALGSWWALIPAMMLPLLLVARILNEEKVLKNELDGYAEYTRHVKYRLIPGIW